MSNTLEERGRALEDEFFHKESQKKLAEMRTKLDAASTREELRKASGMSDDAVLDQLVKLGIKGNTVAALSLVPSIAVAWADGTIQAKEREAVLQRAHGKGLEQGSDGYALLSSWLDRKPDAALLDAWEACIKAIIGQLNDDQTRLLKNQVVGLAKVVASAAGGILGINKVSASEEKVLERIDAAFKR